MAVALNLADDDREAPQPPGPWTIAAGRGASLDGELVRLEPCAWGVLCRPEVG